MAELYFTNMVPELMTNPPSLVVSPLINHDDAVGFLVTSLDTNTVPAEEYLDKKDINEQRQIEEEDFRTIVTVKYSHASGSATGSSWKKVVEHHNIIS